MNRDRLVIQFWGQARDAILAFARKQNVTIWGAARMLVCKGAGVEYVEVRRGRRPNGQRKRPVRPDGWKRSLLPGMPEEARTMPRKDYDRLKRHYRHLNAEAASIGVTVAELIERRKGVTSGSRLKPFTRTRDEVVRVAQAKSARVRHAGLLARFAAVVPEELRARYEGRERETMKRWRRAAKKRGLAFEEFVGRLMAAKLAHPEAANPHAFGSMTPKRLAALADGNAERSKRAAEKSAAAAEEKARRLYRAEDEWRRILDLVPAAARARYEGRERVLKSYIRWIASDRKCTFEEAAAAVGTRRPRKTRVQEPAHPWHAPVNPAAARSARAGKPKLAALAAMPAPAQTATTSRFRNCATCAHGGLLKCRPWPSLRAAANLVCEHYASDLARPSARELGEDFDAFF